MVTVARYETKNPTGDREVGDLYCSFHLSDEAYRQMGSPAYMKLSREGDAFRLEAGYAYKDARVWMDTNHKPTRWGFNLYEAFFPGAKVFGKEQVGYIHDGKTILAEMPSQSTPVRKRTPQSKSAELSAKILAVNAISDVDLVAALRQRLQQNARWRIVATDEGRNFCIDTGSL